MGKPVRQAMKEEIPEAHEDGAVLPHAQEVECALILQRMIDKVKDDPTQMRLAIYEFARARLTIDTAQLDESERKRLSAALETAINGVERFSARHVERLEAPPHSRQIGQGTALSTSPSVSLANVGPITPGAEDIIAPDRIYPRPYIQILEVPNRKLVVRLALVCAVIAALGAVASFALRQERLPQLGEQLTQSARSAAHPNVATAALQSPAPVAPSPAPVPSNSPPFPVPSDYGVYGLSNGTLSELYRLPERVPDKRIAISTPVNEPSRTTLSDGKAKFILYRRDIAENAPDRVEVRVIARVVRALTFDAKGKPNFLPVSNAWNIRNISYEFRVRPVPGKPEMLLVQSEKPEFALPPGRYALVLRDQGYDFTIAGKVADVAHCLERTDAANGSFYSECQKP